MVCQTWSGELSCVNHKGAQDMLILQTQAKGASGNLQALTK